MIDWSTDVDSMTDIQTIISLGFRGVTASMSCGQPETLRIADYGDFFSKNRSEPILCIVDPLTIYFSFISTSSVYNAT